MKKILLLSLCLTAMPAWSSHIVGGEFEFLFQEYNGQFMRYSLNLILYFDLKNGNPDARDQFVDIRIFRKRDDAVMRDLRLYLTEETQVEYFQPECSSGSSIQTSRIYYVYRDPLTGQNAFIDFDPDVYDDPEGYYISWERCCRNYTLTNIFSENPEVGSPSAGQTFYLEFPSMKKDGEIFYNSSPRLFPPLADYACPNVVYYVDFSGSDDDGDSLVYSLITPLSTHYISPLPPNNVPEPRPYPDVQYRPGFSFGNVMKGKPDLAISWDGVLTVTPTVAGLYAFAVLVEEFRNKIKIGEVRRDFQMLVLSSCPTSEKPIILAKHTEAPDSEYGSSITVTTTNRCFDVKVYDPDSQTRNEVVTISAFLVNDRRRNITSQIVSNPVQVLSNNQPAIFTMCFPECPFEDRLHEVGIIVSDKACPLPRKDTVYVTVDIPETFNADPLFDKEIVIDVITEGLEIPAWKEPFEGTDADGEQLTLTLNPETEFDPADYGFTLQIVENVPGKIAAQLSWDTRCDVFDFSKKTDFEFSYILDDNDKCDTSPSDTIKFDLTRDFKDFHYPVITYPPLPNAESIVFDQKLYETLSFVAEGSDVDNDLLDLKGQGVGFSMSSVGASFPDKTFVGKGQQTFTWRPSCDFIDLAVKDTYDFELIVIDDDNICNYVLTDTLFVTVNVLPPDNIAPVLAIDGNTTRETKEMIVGETLALPVQGTDGDTDPADKLTLELIGATGTVTPQNFTFETTPALAVVDGTLHWTPACDIFVNGIYESDFTFFFKVTDDRCYSAQEDLLEVDVHVKDRETPDAEFNPRPNVITSNGDSRNEFFGMYKLDSDGETLINILPVDNCGGVFAEVVIYNRWGRKVYTSDDREFKWYPSGESTGVYYYKIRYSNSREYNGWIHVIGAESK
jgi:hypothetical protein